MTQDFRFSDLSNLGKVRKGSVRDIYDLGNELLLVATDRISCFDCLLKETIPDKGEILTAIAAFWLEKTKEISRNHLICRPDPNCLLVKKCEAIPVEVIVRGYLVGSLAREYAAGKRLKCGVELPDGLKEGEALPERIVTPTTKNHSGHDEDISSEELIAKGIVDREEWNEISQKALALFECGQAVCEERGLVLVDTKYEFGRDEKGILLIDEVHTPDSSRYWKKESQLKSYNDKEYVRQYLLSLGFKGDGPPPSLLLEVIQEARKRYLHLAETLLGEGFCIHSEPSSERIYQNLIHYDIVREHSAVSSGNAT